MVKTPIRHRRHLNRGSERFEVRKDSMRFCVVSYPYEEFATHFEVLQTVMSCGHRNGEDKGVHSSSNQLRANVLCVYDYLRQHYPRDVSRQKVIAFCQIVSYLSDDIFAFDAKALAVGGGSSGALSLEDEKALRMAHHLVVDSSDGKTIGHGILTSSGA